MILNRMKTSCLLMVRPGFKPAWCLRNPITSRLNAHSQTDWALGDQVKKRSRSYDGWEFSPFNTTAGIGSPLARTIYIFVVLLLMLWHKKLISNPNETSCLPLAISYLVTVRMTANDDGLRPSWYEPGDLLTDDWLPEHGASEDVPDGTVRTQPHLLQLELCRWVNQGVS